MKARFFLACVIALAYAPFANAYNDDQAREALQPTVDAIKVRQEKTDSDINDCLARLASLDTKARHHAEEMQNLKGEILALTNAVADISVKVESVGKEVAKANAKANVTIWIAVVFALFLLVFCCLVFWPRPIKPVATNPVLPDTRKCPRCGCERDPGDTVCKNPNCKTRF